MNLNINKNKFSLSYWFGNKEFIKSFLKLSIPAIIQQLISLLVVYVDNFMLATILNEHGTEAKTALGLTNPIISFTTFFIFAWISGSGILLSQYYGNKEFNKTKETLFLRIWFCYLIIIPIIVLITTLPGKLLSITTAIHTNSFEYEYARVYVFIFGLSLIPAIFGFSLANGLMETKRQHISLIASILGVLSNIVLDPIVIIIYKNDPYMAVMMVGVTTIISRIVQMLFCLVYILVKNDLSLNIFYSRNNTNTYALNFVDINEKWRLFDKKTVKHVFKYSMPSFINDTVYCIAFVIMNVCFLSYGEGNENYYNAITNTLLLVSLIEIIWPGMGSATSILVAAKLGEGKIIEARTNANILFRWSIIVTLLVIGFLFICTIFINDVLSPGNEYVIKLSQRLQWIILPILFTQGLFSSLYFSIRCGGTKMIVLADCFVMVIWSIVLLPLTLTHVINNLSPELFLFIIESNQIAKFIIASIVYKKSNWAKKLTYNKNIYENQ